MCADTLPPVLAVHIPRQTKVTQLQIPVSAHEDVVWLQVAVHYPVRVQELECERQVCKVEPCVLASQRAMLQHERAEGFAGCILHEEVVMTLVVKCIDEPADERVPWELGEVPTLRVPVFQSVGDVYQSLFIISPPALPCVLVLI